MHCLTPTIPIRWHYTAMPSCSDCPHFAGLGADACHQCVVELTGGVIYQNGMFIKGGFCFNGASIPRLFWTLIGSPFDYRFRRAALYHDAMYHSHMVSKREADRGFLDLLKAEGVSWWKRTAMWMAVSLFGRSSYDLPEHVVEHWKKYVTRL